VRIALDRELAWTPITLSCGPVIRVAERSGTAREDARVVRLHVRVRPITAVTLPSSHRQRDLLARRLRVDVDEDDVRLSPGLSTSRSTTVPHARRPCPMNSEPHDV
jgi:hypothetical protein